MDILSTVLFLLPCLRDAQRVSYSDFRLYQQRIPMEMEATLYYPKNHVEAGYPQCIQSLVVDNFMNLPNAVSRSLYRKTQHLLNRKAQKRLLWSLSKYDSRRGRSVLGWGILKQSPEQLVASTKERKEYDVLRSSVFKSLDESPIEQKLPSVHDDMESHHKNFSKLVVEEAIMACISGLDKQVQSLEKGKKAGRSGVSATIVYRSDDYCVCFTHRPLSPFFRRELKSGTVIALIPKGEIYKPDNLVFGIIKLGSLASELRKY